MEVASSDGHYGVGGAQDDGPEEPYRRRDGLGACLKGSSEEAAARKGIRVRMAAITLGGVSMLGF